MRACVEQAVCGALSSDFIKSVDYCVSSVAWSAERAIPVSYLLGWSERAEYFVKCQLDNAGDCEAQKDCWTLRPVGTHCEGDGCRASYCKYTLTCEGDVAHIERGSVSVERDCARAYAECDTASPTGCTDRVLTGCPPDLTESGHCDGDVRLGCDAMGHVSYRDCSRLGGVCGVLPDGSHDCIYPGPADPKCIDSERASPGCEDGMVAACVKGARVKVSVAGACTRAVDARLRAGPTKRHVTS